MSRLLYESKDPEFAILLDSERYLLTTDKDESGWTKQIHYPTLLHVLDILRKRFFVSQPKKVTEITNKLLALRF